MPQIVRPLLATVSILALSILGCSSGTEELVDLIKDPPSRERIDRSIVGVNNFFNQPEFGSTAAQFSEIKNTLKINHVRALIAWDNNVQPSPTAPINFALFDQIVENIPGGSDVLFVVVHTPTWFTNPANWIGGNPRRTWVERFLRPVVARYAGRRGIIGWEIWNEPDFTTVPSDSVLGLEQPGNYFELLALGVPVVRNLDPSRLVLNAATRSIVQNYPNTLNYNKELQRLGAPGLVDVWNIHYYSEQFENVIRPDGVGDFLNGIGKPIWVTESGETGVNRQLAYAETVWPFLQDKISGIDRIYWYEFAGRQPAGQTFGLRTNDPNAPVSDLYIWLRDN